MRRRRSKPANLTEAELRVLEAFSCGRITAGTLSAELARARRERATEPAAVLRPRAEPPVVLERAA